MIRIFLLLALLIASVWLGVHLQGDPGYVLIAVKNWTLESTVWVFLIAVLLLFAALHLFFSSYYKAIHLPFVWHQWRAKRKSIRAQDKTTQGLIEFSEGYWGEAKKHLIEALPNTETPLINYLIAARAAQELGDTKERDQYLRTALRSMPDAKIAVELTQAQLQLAHKQYEQALATLRHLHDLAPKHPYVLKLLARLYELTEDWQHLIELLPSLKKSHALKDEQLSKLTQTAYLGRVHQHINQSEFGALDLLIKKLPATLKHEPEIMAAFAAALIKQDKAVQAELCLRRALQKEVTPILLDAYCELPLTAARIPVIETLIKAKSHQYKAELNFCIGLLYMKQQLFGKAQTHLEESIKIQKSAKAYSALGALFESLDDMKAAFNAYKEGLMDSLQL